MRWIGTILLLFTAHTALVSSQSIAQLPTPSVCASVLGYSNFTLMPGYTVSILENAVTQAPNLWSILTPACRRAVALIQCSSAYIPYPPALPCQSMCTSMIASCGSTQAGLAAAFGLNVNCTTYPTTSCNTGAASADVKGPLVPRCETYSGSVCAGIVNYPVYVPWYYNQTDLEAKLIPKWWVFQLASNNTAFGNCQVKLAEYICAQAFQRCDTQVLSTATNGTLALPIPFPRLPCRSMCDTFTYTCQQLIGTFSALTPNCSSVGVNVSPYVDFPVYNTTFATLTLKGYPYPITISTTCNSFSTSEEAAIVVNTPPAPTGSCQTLSTSSVCVDYLNYTSVFVPPGYTLAALEARVSSITTLMATLSTSCAKNLGRFLCGQAYMRCDTPRLTCLSTCAAFKPTNGGVCTTLEYTLIQTFLGANVVCEAFPTPANSAGCNVPKSDALIASDTTVRIPRCEAYTGSICAAVVDYPIYVPWDKTQAQLEALIAPNAPGFLLAPLANGCREQFLQYACSQAFNKCDNQTLSRLSPALGQYFPIPFPRFPCKSICTNFTAVCPAFIYGLNISVNCNSVGTRAPTGLADWPETTSILAAVAGNYLSTTCNSWTAAQVAAFDLDDKLVCPKILVVPNDKSVLRIDPGFGAGTCATPCPSAIYTQDEWEHAGQFFFAMSLCSFILTFFTMMTWILAPSKRKQRYILCFNICVFGVAFATLIPFGGHDHYEGGRSGVGRGAWIGCRNNVEYKNQGDGGWCLFQAIFLYFWAMSAIVWWNIQAFDVFLKIVLGKGKLTAAEKARKHKIYHAIAWSIPTIGLIIGLSTKSMGHQNVLPWCFIGGSYWADWALFYHPVILMCVISICMMIAVIHTLRRTAAASGSNKKPGWWRIHVRPLLFLSQFFLLFIFIYIYRCLQYFKESDYHDSGQELVTCLLRGGGSTCGQADGMLPSDRPPKSLWYLIMFAVGGQGWVHFLLYGTMKDNYIFWWKIITCTDVKSTIGRSIGEEKGSLSNRDGASTKGTSGSAGPIAPHVAYQEAPGNLTIHRDDTDSRGDSARAGTGGGASQEQELVSSSPQGGLSPRGQVEAGGQL